MKIRNLFILSLLLGVLVSAFAALPVAHAGTITVTTLIDESDGSCTDGDCSVRDAVAVASPGDTINFSVTGTINLVLYSEDLHRQEPDYQQPPWTRRPDYHAQGWLPRLLRPPFQQCDHFRLKPLPTAEVAVDSLLPAIAH